MTEVENGWLYLLSFSPFFVCALIALWIMRPWKKKHVPVKSEGGKVLGHVVKTEQDERGLMVTMELNEDGRRMLGVYDASGLSLGPVSYPEDFNINFNEHRRLGEKPPLTIAHIPLPEHYRFEEGPEWDEIFIEPEKGKDDEER